MTTPPSIPQASVAFNNIQYSNISESQALDGIITQLIENKPNYANAGDFLHGIEDSLKGMDSSLSLMTGPDKANWRQFISKINNELRLRNIPEEVISSISQTKNGNELLEVIGNLLKDWIQLVPLKPNPFEGESPPPTTPEKPIIA